MLANLELILDQKML